MVRGTSVSAMVGARQQVLKETTQLENKMGSLETKALPDTEAANDLQEAPISYAELLEWLHLIDYKADAQKLNTKAESGDGPYDVDISSVKYYTGKSGLG
ncbi:hypothetical protein NDU88_006769 [Pleurodeles waltl]|uniref:Uncharacterized protein n=1 Tax=Pleurodeles waltl TaxID=8319 RepID=A0AAV7SQS6_PLEWA|nr:hypothetical protein NDU88_006769 [Pleurodeles waltl]